jgi:hypothetical protein
MADDDQTLLDLLINRTPPTVVHREEHGRAAVEVLDDGTFAYRVDGALVQHGYSSAEATSREKIDTRRAERVSVECANRSDVFGDARLVTTVYREGELELRQEVALLAGGELVTQVHLSRLDGGEVETRFLAPFSTPYPGPDAKPVFLSLDQKMLRVPYDNDMWVRYESAVPDPGRESYDVTAIFDEHTFEGLVIGAVDFDVWKNAIRWDGFGSRAVTAYSGAAGLATHDLLPHGVVRGTSVASARFVVLWADDVKRGMERYADLCVAVRPARPWSGPVPFGWNSYSGLAIRTTVDAWSTAGDLLIDELTAYRDAEDVVYVNLDGAFGLDLEAVRAKVDDIHARGHKAGWYAAPCGGFPGWDRPIGDTGLTTGDIMLRDDRGEVLPVIDHSIPLDVTHPAWEVFARGQVREILDLGFDYLKIDFLTHASVEGAHHLAHYTGRMALNHAYEILSDEIGKAGRDVFVSLSIAPLFPYFLGHARRASCDVFGRFDDTRYVLNAQNFSWWTSGRLYAFNDPDHTPLYRSAVDGREASSFAEARSRYLASVIGGTVMMLSDDYGPDGDPTAVAAARERARAFANNPEVNAVARLGRAFVPAELGDGTTPFYTLTHEGRSFAAVFNFAPETRTLAFPADRGDLPPSGRLRDLYTGEVSSYASEITVTLDGYDAVLLEVLPGSPS